MKDMERATPSLRVAALEDADQITRLEQSSIAALFPAFYDDIQTRSAIEYVAHVDLDLVADATYYVLEVGHEIVGCGGWSRRDRLYTGSGDAAGDARLLDPATEAARVRAMFVRPDWTRRGLGRRILDQCEADAAREGYLRLGLMATLPGVLLYRAFGFLPTGPEQDVVLEDGVRLACLPMEKPIARAARAVSPPIRRATAAST